MPTACDPCASVNNRAAAYGTTAIENMEKACCPGDPCASVNNRAAAYLRYYNYYFYSRCLRACYSPTVGAGMDYASCICISLQPEACGTMAQLFVRALTLCPGYPGLSLRPCPCKHIVGLIHGAPCGSSAHGSFQTQTQVALWVLQNYSLHGAAAQCATLAALKGC